MSNQMKDRFCKNEGFACQYKATVTGCCCIVNKKNEGVACQNSTIVIGFCMSKNKSVANQNKTNC